MNDQRRSSFALCLPLCNWWSRQQSELGQKDGVGRMAGRQTKLTSQNWRSFRKVVAVNRRSRGKFHGAGNRGESKFHPLLFAERVFSLVERESNERGEWARARRAAARGGEGVRESRPVPRRGINTLIFPHGRAARSIAGLRLCEKKDRPRISLDSRLIRDDWSTFFLLANAFNHSNDFDLSLSPFSSSSFSLLYSIS